MKTLIGKKVNIKKSIESPYAGEWGVVKLFDGQDYHVALWDGDDRQGAIVLDRKEFVVSK